MKEVLKNHWPVVITAVAGICCMVQFAALPDNEDPLGFIITYFGIVIPICALIASVWYGYRMKGIYKWGIVIGYGLLEFVLVLIASGEWEMEYIVMASFAAVPAFVGMVLGCAAKFLVERRSE